jgi:hypothetical protein
LKVTSSTVAKTILEGWRFNCAVEETDPGWERCREVVLLRIQKAFTVRTEATESHTECEAQMICRRFTVVLFLVVR